MGTRTNFYKNPSYAYNKHFSLSSVLQNLRAYNAATGSLPPADEPPPSGDPLPSDETKPLHKRRREPKIPLDEDHIRIEHNDGPMSHQDYVQKRRMECEVSSSQAYQKLSVDVLVNSNSRLLVEYESDDSTSDCEDAQGSPDSDQKNVLGQIKNRKEQRFPVEGEPVCAVCGKYGEYICNETDDDICSMDCKFELLKNLKSEEGSHSNQSLVFYSSGPLDASQVATIGVDNEHCFPQKQTTLCTYKCWKCQRAGHLADDCLVVTSYSQSPSSTQARLGQKKSIILPRELRELYGRSRNIGKNLSNAKCNVCCSSLALTTCLDCSVVLCDNSGHLNEHILAHPSHRHFYSHKLKRLVKCCKATCSVTDIKDLLACPCCFDKAFDKFYDMYTATWRRAGLSIIWGSICCEEHFAWHRINCINANVEDSAYIVRRGGTKGNHMQLSDFIF